jgi:choice-of-anchor B domain-containing protein
VLDRQLTRQWAAAAGMALLLLPPFGLAHDDGSFPSGGANPYEGPGWTQAGGGDVPLIFPSSGVELLAWLPLHEFGDHSSGNDCWGYASPSGREYAIIGLRNGTGFVEITNPGDPQIIAVIAGPNSLWRDIKTYQHHAYAVSEGGGGIQVMDLSQIDEGIVTYVGSFNPVGQVTTDRTHNVAIDEESGYLYRCGGGGGSIGIRIYSLANPALPAFVGEWHGAYVHDAQVVVWHDGPYAGREIAFLSANNGSGGGNPRLTILDVTNKSNPAVLGVATYPWPAFSHQSWLTPDRRHVFLNDELAEQIYGIPTTTRVINVEDLTNPFAAATFTNNNTAIGHNIYTRGRFSFHANYRSGLRVFDAIDPLAPVEVAYFNTYPPNDNPSFNSLWSNYPYFSNGVVIGSDLEKGLFIWRVPALIECRPDLNGDGTVDVLDLLTLLDLWGPCIGCAADLNDDGEIDVLDLLILLDAWGPCPQSLAVLRDLPHHDGGRTSSSLTDEVSHTREPARTNPVGLPISFSSSSNSSSPITTDNRGVESRTR